MNQSAWNKFQTQHSNWENTSRRNREEAEREREREKQEQEIRELRQPPPRPTNPTPLQTAFHDYIRGLIPYWKYKQAVEESQKK